jgi:hypothetical protein
VGGGTGLDDIDLPSISIVDKDVSDNLLPLIPFSSTESSFVGVHGLVATSALCHEKLLSLGSSRSTRDGSISSAFPRTLLHSNHALQTKLGILIQMPVAEQSRSSLWDDI